MNPDDDYFDDPRNGLPLQSEWPYNKWEEMDDLSRRAWVQMAKEFGMLVGFFTFVALVIGGCWALFQYGPLWLIRTIVGGIILFGIIAFIKATHTDTVKRLEMEDKIHPPKPRPRKVTPNLVDNRLTQPEAMAMALGSPSREDVLASRHANYRCDPEACKYDAPHTNYTEMRNTIDSINKHQAEIDKIRKEEGVEPGEPLIGLEYLTSNSAGTAWVTKENPR